MPHLMLKDLPKYECLLEASQKFPELDPSACEVFLHLLRAGDDAFRVCDGTLSKHHVSQGRFTVLMLLFDKGTGCPKSHTPAELAEHAGVTRATMTGLIDTLERDGLVTRTPDPTDRRMMSVNLTPHGVSRLREILPAYFKRVGALISVLSESERRTMVTLLGKILDKAAELTAPFEVPLA